VKRKRSVFIKLDELNRGSITQLHSSIPVAPNGESITAQGHGVHSSVLKLVL